MRFLIAFLCLSYLSFCNGATIQVTYYSDAYCATQVSPKVQIYPATENKVPGTLGIETFCLTSNIPTGFAAATAACGTPSGGVYSESIEFYSSSSACTQGPDAPSATFSSGAVGGCGTLTSGSVPGGNIQSVRVVCISATCSSATILSFSFALILFLGILTSILS